MNPPPLVKHAKCINVDNPATVSFAQGVCGSVGVTLNLPSPNNNAAAASPAAAAPASGQATQAAASAPDDSEGVAANAGTAPTSSYEAGAWAPTSTAAVSACSNPPTLTLASTSTHTSTHTSTSTTILAPGKEASTSLSFDIQSYTIVPAYHTNNSSSSPKQITTTTTTACKKTACSNSTYNATVNTSMPVPFQGKAASQRLQWASVALVVGAVGAFVAL